MARKRKSEEIEVRATRTVAGLRAGRIVTVDPKLPWVKAALENRSLVPTDEQELDKDDK